MSKLPTSTMSKNRNPLVQSKVQSSTSISRLPSNSQTRGEKLFEFFKSIGYQPSSKHLKPEHLEYLFRDEKTAKLLKGFAKKARADQGLTPEEVIKFESLKADGIALYGVDLEEAVDRRHMFEKRIADEKDVCAAEKEELRKRIAQRKAEIDEIKKRDAVISSMITEAKKSKALEQRIVSQMQRDSQELNIAIQVTEKRLHEKAKAVKDIKGNLLENDNVLQGSIKNAQDLIAINWKEILEQEDELIQNVKPLIENHVAHLIIQAEGFEDERSFGEAKSEMLHRVLTEYVENFERLKHSIIYERVRSAELEIKLAGEEGALNMIKPCYDQLTRAWRTGGGRDVYEKMEQELDNSIGKLQETFDQEFVAATEAVRERSLAHINLSFQNLMNMKAPAKKRLQSFFSRLYLILEPQKIRMDIMRNILKEGVNYFHGVVDRLEEFALRMQALNTDSQVITGNLNKNDFTADGLALLSLLSQHDIPHSVLQSCSSTSVALAEVHRKIGETGWNALQQEASEYNHCLNNLTIRHQELSDIYKSLNEKYFTKNSKEKRLVEELEQTQSELKNMLNLKHENKFNIVDESIAEKQKLLQKMKDVLAVN